MRAWMSRRLACGDMASLGCPRESVWDVSGVWSTSEAEVSYTWASCGIVIVMG